mmetsp:Transcript_17064/g.28495  ORF Transcript_17064/g.28495 Transcript_17064/m.28495 type:complete len:266 (+) Transcript_17064:914-1711(+)
MAFLFCCCFCCCCLMLLAFIWFMPLMFPLLPPPLCMPPPIAPIPPIPPPCMELFIMGGGVALEVGKFMKSFMVLLEFCLWCCGGCDCCCCGVSCFEKSNTSPALLSKGDAVDAGGVVLLSSKVSKLSNFSLPRRSGTVIRGLVSCVAPIDCDCPRPSSLVRGLDEVLWVCCWDTPGLKVPDDCLAAPPREMRDTFSTTSPLYGGTTPASSTKSSHTFMSPTAFSALKWYLPGTGKAFRNSERVRVLASQLNTLGCSLASPSSGMK